MIQIHSEKALQALKEKSRLLLVHYGSRGCGPCLAIERKLTDWEADHPGVSLCRLSLEELPALAAQEGIFAAPALLLYAEGKLAVRESGCFSLEDILSKVEFYDCILT